MFCEVILLVLVVLVISLYMNIFVNVLCVMHQDLKQAKVTDLLNKC